MSFPWPGTSAVLASLLCASRAWAEPSDSPTTIFSPSSTPAYAIRDLSFFVLTVTGLIFVGVAGLLVYTLVRYRMRPGGESSEPPQVFGSTQVELAWTIIPILLLTVLFLGTARVLFAVEDAPKPPSALDVTVIGHQFWWEFRYPKYSVITANELHVPLSDPKAPTPSFLKLTSADVIHSFWVPRLAGKTDLFPNRVNELWIDPHEAGMFEGQCAQFCGTQHAKMLLRIYVDTPEQFSAWIAQQQKQAEGAPMETAGAVSSQPGLTSNPPNEGPAAGVPTNTPSTKGETAKAAAANHASDPVAMGRQVFLQQACINCHTVAGTVANGRFGPDLTHLMSRHTIAAGAAPNTQQTLQMWIADPNSFKPGSLMPAMHLTDEQNAQIAAYLATLK